VAAGLPAPRISPATIMKLAQRKAFFACDSPRFSSRVRTIRLIETLGLMLGYGLTITSLHA
jgi:hypothetical protein